MAATYNELGKRISAEGLKLGVHAHMWSQFENRHEFDRIMDATDPKYVWFVLDTGHVTMAGLDPLELTRKLGHRIIEFHLNDVDAKYRGGAKERRDRNDAMKDPIFFELELLVSKPTVNIEGLVAGYTGPGGKTILPHRAVAKIDMRLVPNLTAKGALAALRAHLAKKGFGDIEVNMTGGYDPTSTPADSALIRAETAVYRSAGIDSIIWPRIAGSWPGYVFSGDPLKLPAGHFGLGHGNGAHAPTEYHVIESSNPKFQGMDCAVLSHVEFLYEMSV